MNTDRTVTRKQYKGTRLILRANGRYALRWVPERIAKAFRALLDAPADDLAEKAQFLAAHNHPASNGPGTMGAQWTAYARKGSK